MPLRSTSQTCDPSCRTRTPPANATGLFATGSTTSADRPAGIDTASLAEGPAAGPSTSLESHELNAQFALRNQSPYERYRHDCWAKTRLHIAATLERVGTPAKTWEKFCHCGSHATVQMHTKRPSTFRLLCNKCRHRMCFACQRDRGWIISQNLVTLASGAGRNLSLLTLTLKHNARDLRAEIKRLLVAFRELRRCLLWKRNVKAAAYTLEIKVGKDGRWHVHLHCLCHNTYMEQGRLTAAWLTCTGDSTQVDIRRISPGRGARYISKYVTKPVDESILRNQAKLEEFILATRGVRKCSTLGAWRGCPLAEHPKDEALLNDPELDAPANWLTICQFDDLLKGIRSGDPTARDIFSQLRLRPPKGSDP